MEFGFVSLEIDPPIASVALNRPPVNALNQRLVDEIEAIANELTKRCETEDIRAAILKAEGKHFCAGADLKERETIPDAQVEAVVGRIRSAVNAVDAIPVPTIAAVQGTAVGGGLELALAADFRILSSEAEVGLREAALGIIPGAGGTQRLTRLIGYSNALFWMCTAQTFSAVDALHYGVATLVVPRDLLEVEAHELAETIAGNAPVAVRQIKRAAKQGLEMSLAEGLKLEAEGYRATIGTEDRREGLAAFKEKRAPVYRGT